MKKFRLILFLFPFLFIQCNIMPPPRIIMPPPPPGLGDYYVSTSGSDTNSGTSSAPFRTVQKGLDTATSPGGTVYVRNGRYPEPVVFKASGNAQDGYITLRNYPGETPILTGPGHEVDDWHCIYIEDKSYLKVIGMTCTDVKYSAGGWQKSLTRTGIRIKARDNSHIEIRDNHIYEMRGPGTPSQNSYIGGIIAFGISQNVDGGLSYLIIDNNLIHDVDVNNDRAIGISGNVRDFEITNNEVHRVDNILIGMLAWDASLTEQTGIPPRNGVVRGNYLHDSKTFGGSAGIYLNGPVDITVEENLVIDNMQGISVNSENYALPHYHSRGIVIQNNLVVNNVLNGFSMAHMDWIDGLTYRNNTVYQAEGGDPVQVGNIRNAEVFNNIIVGNANKKLILDFRNTQQNLNFNNNLYYTTSGESSSARFVWKGTTYTGFDNYRSGTGQDSDSIFADPKFVNPDNLNFRLQSGSPAIGIGADTDLFHRWRRRTPPVSPGWRVGSSRESAAKAEIR